MPGPTPNQDVIRVKHCQYCGGRELIAVVASWDATSQEEQGNDATLDEYQCLPCGLSFWVGDSDTTLSNEDLERHRLFTKYQDERLRG